MILQPPENAAFSESTQQSNSQGETKSISCQAWLVFITGWLSICGQDYWWAGWGIEETLSLHHHAKESSREWLRLILRRIAALKKFYIKPDQQIFFADKWIQLGRKTKREMSNTAFWSCDTCVDTQSHYGGLCKLDTDINEDYEFCAAALKLKNPFLKFCRAFAFRVFIALVKWFCQHFLHADLCF